METKHAIRNYFVILFSDSVHHKREIKQERSLMRSFSDLLTSFHSIQQSIHRIVVTYKKGQIDLV